MKQQGKGTAPFTVRLCARASEHAYIHWLHLVRIINAWQDASPNRASLAFRSQSSQSYERTSEGARASERQQVKGRSSRRVVCMQRARCLDNLPAAARSYITCRFSSSNTGAQIRVTCMWHLPVHTSIALSAVHLSPSHAYMHA